MKQKASAHDWKKLGILVIGTGSIGRRHLRNLQSLGLTTLAAYDPDPVRVAEAQAETPIESFSTLDRALAWNPDCVFICTPPTTHIPLAHLAISGNAHLFIEKPLGNQLDGIDELIASAHNKSRVALVGYNLRFHEGLQKCRQILLEGLIGKPLAIRAEVGQYLPDWRPGRDYRTGYIAHQSEGGGIILDASHELDYVRWLGGEVDTLSCTASHVSDLEMDTEDLAAITWRTVGRLIAEIHLDCIQREYSRNCKVIGSEGTLQWDYNSGVSLFTSTHGYEFFPIKPDPNSMYLQEVSHFFDCVNGIAEPLAPLQDGKRVLQIALASQESARLGHEVKV